MLYKLKFVDKFCYRTFVNVFNKKKVNNEINKIVILNIYLLHGHIDVGTNSSISSKDTRNHINNT